MKHLKSVVLSLTVALVGGGAFGATPVWIGGTSGDVSDLDANWSGTGGFNECMMYIEGTEDYNLYFGSDFSQNRLNIHQAAGVTAAADFDLRLNTLQPSQQFNLYGVKATFHDGTIKANAFKPGGQSQDGKTYYGTDVTFSNVSFVVSSPTTGYGIGAGTTKITAYDSTLENLPYAANGTNLFVRSTVSTVYGWASRFGDGSNFLFRVSDHSTLKAKDGYALGRFGDKLKDSTYVIDDGSVVTNMPGVYVGCDNSRNVTFAMSNSFYHATAAMEIKGENSQAIFYRTPYCPGYDKLSIDRAVNIAGTGNGLTVDNAGEDFIGSLALKGAQQASVLIKGARYAGSGIWYGTTFSNAAADNEVCFESCAGIATNMYFELPVGTARNAFVAAGAGGKVYLGQIKFNGTDNKLVARTGGELIIGGSNWPQLMTDASSGGCGLRIEDDASRMTFTPDKQNIGNASSQTPFRLEFKPGANLFNGTAPLTFTTLVKSGAIQVAVDGRAALKNSLQAKIPLVRSSVANGLSALSAALDELNATLVTEPAGGVLTMEDGVLYCTVKKQSGLILLLK